MKFIPKYTKFKKDCENMQVKDALKKNPFMEELFYMTADSLLKKQEYRYSR
jgi:hypothetical protein